MRFVGILLPLAILATAYAGELSNPCDGAGPGSECFGSNQQIGSGNQMTMIGHNADTKSEDCFSQCTCIGDSCEAWGFETTSLGYHAAALGNDSIAIGVQAQGGTQSGGGTSSVAIGVASFCVGDSSECLGRSTYDGQAKDNIILGREAASGGQNSVLIIGSQNHPVTDGFVNSSARGAVGNRVSFIQHGASGKGTDSSGASYKIAGGFGTGNAAGGDVGLQTSVPQVSGATPQSNVDRIVARGKLRPVTDSIATNIVEIELGSNSGGAITVAYGARARSFPNIEQESGMVTLACSEDDSGTVIVGEPAKLSSDSGSLNVTFSGASGQNACDLQVTLKSSLTAPSEDFYYTVINNGLQGITPF